MKYKNPISFLILLLLSVTCFSQSIVPRANSSYTVMDSRFKAQYNLFVPAYADTTAANLQIGVDSLGAVIFTYDNMSLMVRSGSPKTWVEVGSGGGGGGMTNPMTTAGDIIIGGASGTPARLASGTATYVLTSNGAGLAPSWQEIPSNNLIVQTAGSGISIWYTSGDSLYLKAITNATANADSSLTIQTLENTNLTLTGDRTVDGGTNDLAFTNGGVYSFAVSTATASPDANAALFVDGGTLQYAAEFVTRNTSFSGFLVRSTLGTAAPFVQLQNDGNSKIWTTILETDNSFSIREGNAAGTQRINIAHTTGNITLSSLSGNGAGFVAVDDDGVLSWSAGGGGGSGTVNSGTQYRIAYYATTGTAVSEAAVITASRALVSDVNGVPTHATTTATEIGYVNGVTSAIQTQLNNRVDNSTTQTGIAGNKTWTGSNFFTGGIFSSTGATVSNLTANGGAVIATGVTTAQFLFQGATAVSYRVALRGSTSSTLSAGHTHAAFIQAVQGVTEAASNTHAAIVGTAFLPLDITNGTASTTNAATVYIDGPPTGTAVITNPVNSLWINSGNVLMSNGNITLATAGNKINIATGSNASVGVSGAMTAGSITISTTAVTANSIIQLTPVGAGSGQISIGTITAGTSFVINSSDGADVRTVHWTIIN